MNTVEFVLGAPDPEMAAIERLLLAAGVPYQYAVMDDGSRVTPATAYQCAEVDSAADLVVLVERAPRVNAPGRVVTVDHHRPGDAGYGLPPAEYMMGSSIGQVLDLLASEGYNPLPGEPHLAAPAWMACGLWHSAPGRWTLTVVRNGSGRDHVTVPEGIALTAAADHCLAHAYRGRCPGVDPDALMEWRAETRAAFQGRPVSQVLADVYAARDSLRARHQSGEAIPHYPETLPELPEASAREGIPFTAVVDGGKKLVLQGATADQVRDFMGSHPGSYGDPARGFSGANGLVRLYGYRDD